MDRRDLILKIVETWNLSGNPEYRGFRCANCQNYENEAYYHWVDSDLFRLPVHFCESCQKKLLNDEIKISHLKKGNTDINPKRYPKDTEEKLEEIIAKWPKEDEKEKRAYSCDLCKRDLLIDEGQRKGFHVWFKMKKGKTLAELHFHKICAENLNIFP